jgi:hypothetical protein
VLTIPKPRVLVVHITFAPYFPGMKTFKQQEAETVVVTVLYRQEYIAKERESIRDNLETT